MKNKVMLWIVLTSVCLTLAVVSVGIGIGAVVSRSEEGVPSSALAADTDRAPEGSTAPVVGGTEESIEIPGFEKLVMKADTLQQTVEFSNPANNSCYFQISILLHDGREVYRSGLLKPGTTLKSIEISHKLESGRYKDAVLQYDCFTIDDTAPLNGAKPILELEVIP